MAEERLQKVLAAAGVASRRASEELIASGRVTVNGHTVTELGTKVDPNVAQIAVDGKPIKMHKRHIYLKLHKPRGVLSDIGGNTMGRQTVADLLPPEMRRLFPVGRLDLNSEGLVLMTDDGELANKLTHPRYEHPKTYYVLVAERPTLSALESLRTGVELPDGKSAPAEVRVVQALPHDLRMSSGPTNGVWLEVVLREGKKRQIRHMTAAVGHPTLRLIRWAIGPLTLDDLKSGDHAHLQRSEVAALQNAMREGGQPALSAKEQEQKDAAARRTRSTPRPEYGAGKSPNRNSGRKPFGRGGSAAGSSSVGSGSAARRPRGNGRAGGGRPPRGNPTGGQGNRK